MSDSDHPDDPTSDYLWDGSGDVDPDVQRLERLLAPAAHRAPEKQVRAPWHRLAAAAVLVAGVAVGWTVGTRAHERQTAMENGWDVVVSTSAADAPVPKSQVLPVGGWLETDVNSTAEITVADIGRVTVSPRSRIALIRTDADQHRLELAHGRISAVVVAPPRLFVVDTPAATAVDLGCAYTLEVDPLGAGMLVVTSGEVSLERDGFEPVVPAGARCRIYAGTGPGTPVFEDAAAAFIDTVDRFDAGTASADAVITAAGEDDTLTLFHMLPRVSEAERGRLHDALAARVSPPAGLTRSAVQHLDPAALDGWRDELDWRW